MSREIQYFPGRRAGPVPPARAISCRAFMWSIMTGVAVARPALYLMLLLPLPASSAEFSPMVADRKALFYLLPGALFLKAVLIYPLIEEVFYRGLMFSLPRRYVPMGAAALAPTSLFALTHIGAGLVNIGFAFLVGRYFRWLVVRNRSLCTSVLCRATINFFMLFVFNPITAAHDLVARAGAFTLLPFGLLAGSLVLLAYGVRFLRPEFTPRRPTGAVPLAPHAAVAAA